MEVFYIIGGLFFIALCIFAWKRRFLIAGTASLVTVLYLLFRSDQIKTIQIPNVCAIGILLIFTLLILSIPPDKDHHNQEVHHRN